MNKIRTNKIQILIAVVAIAFFGIIFTINNIKKETPKEVVVEKNIILNPYENLSLEAKAIYILDVVTGEVLFSFNGEAQLPLASLTKVMTAVTARELVPKNTIITIGVDAIGQEGDSGLLIGERWRLSDILDLTLVMSSNDGARAIAGTLGAFSVVNKNFIGSPESNENYFINKMNEKATEIGMAQTFFLNESGLDSNEHLSGSYGSAKDMALLFDYVLKNHTDIFEATRKSVININSLDDILHTAKNTNTIVDQIPALIASKTGFTDLANGNLVVAFEAGPIRPIIIAILGSGVDTRFEDMDKLVWASIRAIQQN